jgi:hypothetical protein
MALSVEDMERIGALLDEADTAARAFAELRANFPKLPVTRVDSSDLGMETPFRQYPSFDVYLIDGIGHCWTLTGDPERATGLVIAARRGSP